MDLLVLFNIIISFILLTSLEVLLSIDNILFISLVTYKIHEKNRFIAQKIGVLVAVFARLILLISINFLSKLNKPILFIYQFPLSIKDTIMLIGGLYLVYYANKEIFRELNVTNHNNKIGVSSSFLKVILTIMIFDSFFSFDSILTALALGYNLSVMIASIIISVIILFLGINKISSIISNNISVKILALSFLILVGFNLFIEGLHFTVPKFYLFFIIGFSAFVQIISIKIIKKSK